MRALVTGGGGFLGGAIVQQLLAQGHQVASFARGDYPQLRAQGVTCFQADLANAEAVSEAVRGCDAVFHVAAIPNIWGPYERFYNTNTLGTQHVIDACKKHGVGRLIYTSTPSVIHTGGDVEGLDNTAPYPTQFSAHYPATKALAEQAVLQADGPDLRTVALRPHLVWGPGDNHLLPRIVARAKAGKLKLVGGGHKKIDTVYISNAADAHLLAAERLATDAACAGKAYFITNDDPRPQVEIINGMLNAAGLPPCTQSISPRIAYAAGAIFEAVWTLLRRQDEPLMTRFLARQLATAHWYDTAATRRDIGYTPEVTIEEGFTRLGAWFDTQ